jgi:hypothetical protein
MELPIKIVSFAVGLILITIGTPTLLVKLDLMDASWLRPVPSVIAIILGLAFVWAAVSYAKAKGERK